MRLRNGLRVLEAAVYLVTARLAVRIVPFRVLTRWFCVSPRRPELEGDSRSLARTQVVEAVERAARVLPAETVCFPRAIAVQAMLRRRGVGTTLYCGAAPSSEHGLTAHVWLQDGEVPVTGQDMSTYYRPLGAYPSR